jgi:hypothetical protein
MTPVIEPLSPISTELEIMTPRSTGPLRVPMTSTEAIKYAFFFFLIILFLTDGGFKCRTLIRAARVRRERDDCIKQYEQWRTTQRSRHFTSIGRAAREELDRHAADLKWRRDSQDKLLSSLIDRLAGHAENPHALDFESIQKEAKRYISEVQQWIESLRLSRHILLPLRPAASSNPTTSDAAAAASSKPEASSSQPLDAEGDVEMESGEVTGDDFSDQPEFENAAVARLWTRMMVVEGKLNEIESNPTGDVSPDVAALVELALNSRSTVEDGELSNINDNPKKVLALDQSRAELQRVQEQLSDISKEKQVQHAAAQALETQIVDYRTRIEELESREAEVCLT